jgi:hypothetical protein
VSKSAMDLKKGKCEHGQKAGTWCESCFRLKCSSVTRYCDDRSGY